MIKLFRKMRQKSLSESNFSKFLFYALGEIILLVIGILIALQINNWNNVKQERRIERVNLIALQKEFLENRDRLQKVVQLNNQNIISTEKMIRAFNKESSDTITEKTVAMFVVGSFGNEINFTPETGVLTEILSSGELKYIHNNQLKHKLAGYNSKIEQLEQQEKEVYEYRMMGIKQMIHEGNLDILYVDAGRREEYINSPFQTKGNKALLNSLPLLNVFHIYQASSDIANIRYYETMDQEIKNILELISIRLEEL